MNGQIFISYRRDDASYPPGRLFDRLAERKRLEAEPQVQERLEAEKQEKERLEAERRVRERTERLEAVRIKHEEWLECERREREERLGFDVVSHGKEEKQLRRDLPDAGWGFLASR